MPVLKLVPKAVPRPTLPHLTALLSRWLREDTEVAISKILKAAGNHQLTEQFHEALARVLSKPCRITISIGAVDAPPDQCLTFTQVHQKEK